MSLPCRVHVLYVMPFVKRPYLLYFAINIIIVGFIFASFSVCQNIFHAILILLPQHFSLLITYMFYVLIICVFEFLFDLSILLMYILY